MVRQKIHLVSRPKNHKSSASASGAAHASIDHEEIRKWADARGARPACVRGTGGSDDVGIIRLEFPGYRYSNEESLQPITWEEWFEKFDERNLALIFQETTAKGRRSNFNKLIARDTTAKHVLNQPGTARAQRSTRAGSKKKAA